MAGVNKARLIWTWTQEAVWLALLVLQLPFVFVQKWSSHGRRKEPVLLLTDLGLSVFAYFRIRMALARAGFPVIVLSIGSVSSLASQARQLARTLEQLNIQKGILVAHGRGGLTALALPDSGRRRIQHLVTLGTPFHGSRFFTPFAFVPAFGDMNVGSDFLLLHRMNALLFPGFSPFSAYKDEFIYPGNLGHFGQGRDLILDRNGHMNLILDGENIETIVQHIESLHPEPAGNPEVRAAKPPEVAPPAAKKSGKKPAKKKPSRPGSKKGKR